MIKIKFFSFINSLEPKLLYFFLKYYIKLGIKPQDMYLVIHIDPIYIIEKNKYNDNKIYKTLELINNYKIKHKIVKIYTSDKKKVRINNLIKNTENGTWLIYPDLDEFFNYENMKIYNFIEKLEKDNIDMVEGIFCNRVAKNFKLKPIDVKKDIFKQYPIKYYDNKFNIQDNYKQTKICILKIKEGCKYQNSHILVNMDIYNKYKKLLDVHHFKFTLYTLSTLKNKIDIYTSNNYKNNTKKKNYEKQLDLFYEKDNDWYIKKDKLY